MIGYPGAQILDITGPLEILAGANDAVRFAGGQVAPYTLEIWARDEGPFKTTCGLELIATRSFLAASEDDLASIHTFMVSGGDGTVEALQDTDLIEFIKRADAKSVRTASICSGSFLLAAAGLLEAKRATTHWAAADWFRTAFPHIDLDEDAIFVRDGKIWTSAGITAGMDLALALIEEDLGRDVALSVARRHVMFMMRPGGQSQYSGALTAQAHGQGRLGGLIAWMQDNPQADLSVAALAEQAAMSERTLMRAFQSETGETPARYVERLRVDLARTALSDTDKPLECIAAEAGFQSAEQMRRTFQRHLSINPSDYRSRFQPALNRERPHDPNASQDHRHIPL